MKKELYTIALNEPVATETWKMVLEGDGTAIERSGQFVQIELDGCFLRRPFSVCDRTERDITIVYKVVGRGTAAMTSLRSGRALDIIAGLGNGFDVAATQRKALLIGGSVGTAPLVLLAKELLSAGKEVEVALGFNDASLIFGADEFRRLGLDVHIATLDGSAGVKGVVTAAIDLAGDYDYFYCCGSRNMMKAVSGYMNGGGEFSLDERMGCGTGICYGCTLQTTDGPRRVCADGPVFKKEVILW